MKVKTILHIAVAVAVMSATAAASYAAPQAKAKYAKKVTSTRTARPAKPARLDPEEVEASARHAVEQYDFERLEELARQLPDGSELADSMRRLALAGQSMLERVEKIVVIDSINVDANRFFEHYRLSPSAGQFKASDESAVSNSPVYVTETGLTTFYAHRGENDPHSHIAQARVLADGRLEQPRIYENDKGFNDVAYPFLLTDGLTLYFAATGKQSLGGYDIFITRRGSVDDDFLQSQNLGMPYNSPYNDYLMAIDEASGLGWWASDRNQIPGMVTIYIFRPEELRNNLSTDDPDLLDLASLRSIELTWPEGYVKEDWNDKVAKAQAGGSEPEFEFALPDGRVITRRDQLTDSRSRSLLDDYLEACAEAAADRTRLDSLRSQYASGSRNLASQIESLQAKVEEWPAELIRISNEIVRLETR